MFTHNVIYLAELADVLEITPQTDLVIDKKADLFISSIENLNQFMGIPTTFQEIN